MGVFILMGGLSADDDLLACPVNCGCGNELQHRFRTEIKIYVSLGLSYVGVKSIPRTIFFVIAK